MSDRIVIFSDTHLGPPGRGGRSAQALRPLWAGARKLVLNGDVAELSDPTWRAEAARHVLAIEELCERDGVALELISGNHDPMLTDQRHLRLVDGAVFVTHGDVLHPAISPWNADAAKLRAKYEHALASLPPAERGRLAERLLAVQHASSLKWDDIAAGSHAARSRLRHWMSIPPKAARVIWYWLTMPWRAANFVTQNAPDARFFIFGHYHRAGIWRIGGRVVINTGAFDGHLQPAAVVIEGQQLRTHPIAFTGEEFRLAPQARRSFDLSGNAIPTTALSAASA